jgi:peroxiredoxin
LTFRVFLDPGSAVSDSYHVYGVPSYFLIDKKGYIRSEANTMPLDEARQIVQEK